MGGFFMEFKRNEQIIAELKKFSKQWGIKQPTFPKEGEIHFNDTRRDKPEEVPRVPQGRIPL